MTRRNALTLRRRLAALAIAAVASCAVGAAALPAAASAQTPYWSVEASPVPAHLAPGASGRLVATATNLGDAPMNLPGSPITVTDKLPAGIVATGVVAELANHTGEFLAPCTKVFPATQVSCQDTGLNTKGETLAFGVQPFEGVKLTIQVEVEKGHAEGQFKNTVEAVGGGAATVATESEVTVSSTPATFGVERYALQPEEEGGAFDAAAGSHPFQLTTKLAFFQNDKEEPVELPRNLAFNLPVGMIGNPKATKTCSRIDFATLVNGRNLCSPRTAVGVASVTIDEPVLFTTGPEARTVPVFNLEPARGEPARFGLVVQKVPVVLTTSLRSGKDYGVTVNASDLSQAAGVVSNRVAFWGVPSDTRHDGQRGWACVEKGLTVKECSESITKMHEEETAEKTENIAFLALPTNCEASRPLSVGMDWQSWKAGATVGHTADEFSEQLTGCESLAFNPTVEIVPTVKNAASPTGLDVAIKLPQDETPTGHATSTVRATTVELPKGLELNNGAANGLQACSALQVGYEGTDETKQTTNEGFTPDLAYTEQEAKETGATHLCAPASKVGTVSIKSPDLPNPLNGFVYLAAEGTNPFEPPLIIYLLVKDPESGVVVKLAGKVTPNPVTGQMVSVFENTPSVPFESFTLHFFDGPRASVATPAVCGTYTTKTAMTPWSGNAAATPSSSFTIDHAVDGGTCPQPAQPLVFAPPTTAGTPNLQAGAFSPFELTISRPDGQQGMTGLSLHLPSGMAAMLSSVTPCPIATADANACGEASLVGHAVTVSGLGTEPVTLNGKVFLTGPYNGAPFGLSVSTPAVAGPFNLGTAIVNSTIRVDPNDASVNVNTIETRILDPHGQTTISSTPLPSIIKGVPVELKEIHVTTDRPGFQFNPTHCAPSPIQGTLTGSEGTTFQISQQVRFTGCANLPFSPSLTATASSAISRVNGISFNVKVASAPGQANIAKTKLVIPAAMPSRLTTIQKACPEKTFNANPASCGEGSNIGYAIVHTPVLKSTLTGPAYLVSHGGAAFPDVEFVLQGEGIELILDGKTNIKNGITTSTFEAVPDAPVSTFEAILPAGPHSALTGFREEKGRELETLCGTNQVVPTIITGQNGTVIEQNTPVVLTGCASAPTGGTKAYRLAKELKRCHKIKARKKRVACEKAARKKYGTSTKKHKK